MVLYFGSEISRIFSAQSCNSLYHLIVTLAFHSSLPSSSFLVRHEPPFVCLVYVSSFAAPSCRVRPGSISIEVHLRDIEFDSPFQPSTQNLSSRHAE